MTKKYRTKQTVIDEQKDQIKDLGLKVRLKEHLLEDSSQAGLRRKPKKFQTWCLLKQRSRYGKITTDRTRQ